MTTAESGVSSLDKKKTSVISASPTRSAMASQQVPRIPNFIPTKEYSRLDDELKKEEPVTVVTGISGTGKTVMSCYWIHQKERATRDLDTFRIECSSGPNSIREGLQTFWNGMGLPSEKAAPADLIQHLDMVLSALCENVGNRKWLLLFDDLEFGKTGEFDLFYNKISEYRNDFVKLGAKVIITSICGPPGSSPLQVFKTKEVMDEQEAGEFLRSMAPEHYDPSTLQSILDVVGRLPLALAVFAGELRTNELMSAEEFTENRLGEYSENGNTDSTSETVKGAVKKAARDDPLCSDILKMLSFFDKKNIPADLVIALVEEVGDKGYAEANALFTNLLRRSLVTKTDMSAGNVMLLMHRVIHGAIQNIEEEEHKNDPMERKTLLIYSLTAFTRLMPKDGRQHKSGMLPVYLTHGRSLLKKAKKHLDDSFIKLLCADLCSSLSYCMFSQSFDRQDVKTSLDEGCKLFLQAIGTGCDDFDSIRRKYGIRSAAPDSEVGKALYTKTKSTHLYITGEYDHYIKRLQQYHSLTKRDFHSLTGESEKDYTKHTDNKHLKREMLDRLRMSDDLACRVLEHWKLHSIFGYELFAWHLHLCSRAFREPDDLVEALRYASYAQGIYDAIYDDPDMKMMLSGYVMNMRHLLSLRETEITNSRTLDNSDKKDKLQTVNTQWSDLMKRRDMAYECGLTKIASLVMDSYHEQLCLEGQLDTLGALHFTKKKKYYDDGQGIFTRIETLAKRHPKAITMSKAFRKYAKYNLSWGYKEAALAKLIDALKHYNKYCKELAAKSHGGKSDHPELRPENKKNFGQLYDTLRKIYEADPQIHADKEEHHKYLVNLDECWQGMCQQGETAQPAEDDTYDIIIKIIQNKPDGVGEQPTG